MSEGDPLAGEGVRDGDAGSDAAWLAALAGRADTQAIAAPPVPRGADEPAADGSAKAGGPAVRAAHAEGTLLRATLGERTARLRRENPDGAPDPWPREERLRALLARARREGLLGDATGIPRRRSWRPAQRVVLAAAAVAALAIGVQWQLRAPGPDGPTRAVDSGLVRLESADPAALQRELVAALRAAGVDARAYERLDVYGIDADLPRPVGPAVTGVLERFRVPAPRDGLLQVEIRAAP